MSHCVSHKQTVTAKARQIGTGRAGQEQGKEQRGKRGTVAMEMTTIQSWPAVSA